MAFVVVLCTVAFVMDIGIHARRVAALWHFAAVLEGMDSAYFSIHDVLTPDNNSSVQVF